METALSPLSIQKVLSALPGMFPGAQMIPLKRIRPNPDNPGPPISAEQIQDMADNIAGSGLLNAIKVMPDQTNPLVEGAAPHSENPALRADGRPWEVGDFNWVILAGERRYRAFGRLQRDSIPAFVLNPTAKEAAKITHLDNDVRDRGWWAGYQSIEQLIKADPNLTQRQVAVELKMDKDKVGRALALLPLLNPEARALSVGDSDTSSRGILGISEMAAAQLAGLGPESLYKRGTNKKVTAEGEEVARLWPYPPSPLKPRTWFGEP